VAPFGDAESVSIDIYIRNAAHDRWERSAYKAAQQGEAVALVITRDPGAGPKPTPLNGPAVEHGALFRLVLRAMPGRIKLEPVPTKHASDGRASLPSLPG
jgi:hypothetical protein